jgi:hypothetical protein
VDPQPEPELRSLRVESVLFGKDPVKKLPMNNTDKKTFIVKIIQ